MISNQIKNQHLMRRAGFGPAADQIGQLERTDPKQLFKALQQASSKKPEYIDIADDYLKGLVMGAEEIGRQPSYAILQETPYSADSFAMGDERRELVQRKSEALGGSTGFHKFIKLNRVGFIPS